MKIGIITFQFAWNCGAVLQCYALQETLKKLGHQVCIINYVPDYKEWKYVKYQNPIKVAYEKYIESEHLKNPDRMLKAFKSAGRVILNYSPSCGRLKMKRDFSDFCANNFDLTRKYSTLKELQKSPPECDLYIAGSDQLWNPNLTEGKLDEAYFLNFGLNGTRRATYAVSACELNTQKFGDELERLLKQLDYVSLREKEEKAYIEQHYKNNVYISLDPTFLLDASDYNCLEKKIETKREYVLVFGLDNKGGNETLFSLVKSISDKFDYEIIVISGPHQWPYGIVKYEPQDGISPGEFLSYIKNASFVVTNSFHATAFSIIYHKDFMSITTPGRGSRVSELLCKIGLLDKVIETGTVEFDLSKTKVDYTKVDEYMEGLVDASYSYIKKITK